MHVLPSYVVTDAILTSSTAAESDHAAWSAPTLYTAGTRVIRTTGVHRVFERLITGTTATAPELDPVNWLDVAPTNRWAMFDEAIGTRTSQASPLTVVLSLGAFNDLVLLGVTGTTVTLSGAASRTVSVPAEAVAGQGSTVLIQGLASAGGSLTVSITGSGTVACGTLAVGTFWELGKTSKGLGVDAQDYSRKEFDAWGNASITRRPLARKLNAGFTTALANLDQAERVLAALRSRPVMWMGLSWLDTSIVYGYAKSWSLRRDSKQVTGSLSIQGLALGL